MTQNQALALLHGDIVETTVHGAPHTGIVLIEHGNPLTIEWDTGETLVLTASDCEKLTQLHK